MRPSAAAASGSLFGATGSANFLSRTTAVLAAVFFTCTLALAYLATRVRPVVGQRARARRPAAPAPAAPAAPARLAQIPAQLRAGTAPPGRPQRRPRPLPASGGAAQIPTK